MWGRAPGAEGWVTAEDIFGFTRDSHAIVNGPWERLSSEQGSSIWVMELEFGGAELQT